MKILTQRDILYRIETQPEARYRPDYQFLIAVYSNNIIKMTEIWSKNVISKPMKPRFVQYVLQYGEQTNNRDLVDFATDKLNVHDRNIHILTESVIANNKDMIIYLTEKYRLKPDNHNFLPIRMSIIANTDTHILHYLLKHLYCKWLFPHEKYELVYVAFTHQKMQHLDLLLKYIDFDFIEYVYDFYAIALKYNLMNSISWCVQSGLFDVYRDNLLNIAAQNGNIEALITILETDPTVHIFTPVDGLTPKIPIITAMKAKKLDVVHWILDTFQLPSNSLLQQIAICAIRFHQDCVFDKIISNPHIELDDFMYRLYKEHITPGRKKYTFTQPNFIKYFGKIYKKIDPQTKYSFIPENLNLKEYLFLKNYAQMLVTEVTKDLKKIDELFCAVRYDMELRNIDVESQKISLSQKYPEYYLAWKKMQMIETLNYDEILKQFPDIANYSLQ